MGSLKAGEVPGKSAATQKHRVWNVRMPASLKRRLIFYLYIPAALKNCLILALAAASLVFVTPAFAADLQPEQLLRGPDLQKDDPKPPAAARQTAAPATFGRYPCATTDCAEDKAGYRWAQQHGVTDPDSCTGNSGNFIEGCRVYATGRSATD